MYFAYKLCLRTLVWTLTTFVAFTAYVGTAVGLPDVMRVLQKGADRFLGVIETQFSIPSQYAVWMDAAGVSAALIYVLFYILSLITLAILWTTFKRLCFATGRGLRRLVPRRNSSRPTTPMSA